MPRQRKHANPENNQDEGVKLAYFVKVTFNILKIFSSVLIIFLLLGFGNIFLPDWLLGAKKQIIGILLLILFLLFLLSPLAIEVTKNPRPLSGVGKNPKLPPDLPKIDF